MKNLPVAMPPTDHACASSGAWPPPPWDGEATGRSERSDAAENRRRIIEAARALFAAHGVDQVSMHEVAKAAGLGQGTLYRRYAHKGLLCMALLHDNTRRHHAAVTEQLADPNGSALALLDALLCQSVGFLEENARLLAAMADAACGERRDMAYTNPYYRWLHGTTVALLERAVAEGTLPPLDSAPIADVILAPLGIDLYLYQRQGRGYDTTRIIAAIRQVIITGLGTRETARAGSQ